MPSTRIEPVFVTIGAAAVLRLHPAAAFELAQGVADFAGIQLHRRFTRGLLVACEHDRR